MENKCGECTLCCTLFPIKEINKPINTECVYCDKGCMIWDTKPEECTKFNCAYLQSSAGINLRPDRCGIIFEKVSERLFFGTVSPNRKPSEYALQQITNFNNQGYSVILSSLDTVYNRLFLADIHNELEIQAEFSKYLEKYGNLCN